METQTSFDLSDAIRRWRGAFRTSPVFREQDLDELEGHLRESAADLAGKGLSEEEAFLVAARRLGGSDVLGREFGQVHAERVWIDRALWIITGMMGIQLAWSLVHVVSVAAVALAANLFRHWISGEILGAIAIAAHVAAIVWIGWGIRGAYRYQSCGKFSQAWRWLMSDPIRATVGAALAFFLVWATTYALTPWGPWGVPMEFLQTYLQWQNWGTLVVNLLLWPVLLGFLLTRRARLSAA